MDWLGLSFVDTLHGLTDEMLGFGSGMAEIRFDFWVDQEDLRHRLAVGPGLAQLVVIFGI
jgi:hypothetical protein